MSTRDVTLELLLFWSDNTYAELQQGFHSENQYHTTLMPRPFRIITLSCTLLKALERMVYRFFRIRHLSILQRWEILWNFTTWTCFYNQVIYLLLNAVKCLFYENRVAFDRPTLVLYTYTLLMPALFLGLLKIGFDCLW